MYRKVVLIADAAADDRGLVGPLLGALAEAGATAELFIDGGAGLRDLAGEAVDLMVVDLDAPSLGGYDALLTIGSIAARIPVLLIAGDDSLARRMWAMEAGVVSYVTKPVDGRELGRFIARSLEAFRPGRPKL